MKYKNFQEFNSDVAVLNQQLETHRNKCKNIFLISSAIGVAILAVLICYFTSLAGIFNNLLIFLAKLSGTEWSKTPTTLSYATVLFVLVAIGMWLILWPIFSYRGKDSEGGMIARGYSLQDYVYSKLLACFGDFEFATSGGMFFSDLRRSTILPPYHSYISEDYIKGVINDSTLKIAETSLVRIVNKNRTLVFKGLIVVIDVSETRVKLRAGFAGKTALIADGQKMLGAVADKYVNYQRVALENNALESSFEAYTTNAAEAGKLLKADFIQSLIDLQQLIGNAREQTQHIDDKIAYAVQAMLDNIKWPFSQPAEFEELNNPEPSLDLTKSDPLSSAIDAVNQTVQAEFFDDKLIITIPYTKDLFETNSLFEPALNKEDCLLLFTLMQTVDSITKNLNEHFTHS